MEDATQVAAPRAGDGDRAQGVATFAALRAGPLRDQGRVSRLRAAQSARDVRVRAGDNRQTIALALAETAGHGDGRARPAGGGRRSRDDVRFGADARADRRAVGRSGRAAPAARRDGGRPGAIIRVDSFEGAPLPPKSQIKSIHITRDGFAAENHNAGAFFIDIVTQPGIGPLRGQVQYGMRPGTLTGNAAVHAGQGSGATAELACSRSAARSSREKSSFSLSRPGPHVLHDAEPQRRPADRRRCRRR